MKRAIFAVLGILLLLSVAACSSLYITRDRFASPLSVKLIVRNDDYGDGYFGAKRSGGRTHNGIDYLADVGTPVFAAKSGVVEHARYKRGNGKYVAISHLWGYKTYYCHLSAYQVREGQRVSAGQVIGYVGKTGNAGRRGMQPHLHFEVHKGGQPLDPSGVCTST
jgi:murein DD-endopeptidase MepM/ murein hydrolase activator NlpD